MTVGGESFVRHLAVATIVFAGLFALWPGVDLGASALTFRSGHGFWLGEHPLVRGLRDSVSFMAWAGIGVLVVLFILARLNVRAAGRLDRRRIAFVLLTIMLVPGITVPVLKRVFERPRPAEVKEFGGSQRFVPFLRISPGCPDICASFPSGETAFGFSLVALGLAAESPVAVVAAIAVGCAVGTARVVQGRHFLSDVVMTGFGTTLVALVLYRLIMPRQPGRTSHLALPRGKPAPSANIPAARWATSAGQPQRSRTPSTASARSP